MHGGVYEGPDGEHLHGDGREVGDPMPEKIVPSEEQREWALRVWEDAREQADRHGSGVIADALAAREASQVEMRERLKLSERMRAWAQDGRRLGKGTVLDDFVPKVAALEVAKVEMQTLVVDLVDALEHATTCHKLQAPCTCLAGAKQALALSNARAALQTKEEGTR